MPHLIWALGINLVGITILAYGLYFRRHRRRDLLLGYVAFNVCLFSVSAALGSAPLSIGVGFGLFAVLSIVRLRSDETTQAEIGYTMVSLVLGLLVGLPGLDLQRKVFFALLLVGAMYIADHPVLLPFDRHPRYRIELEALFTDPAELRAELERRLGGEVKHLIVERVDYVRETTRVDVRIKLPAAASDVPGPDGGAAGAAPGSAGAGDTAP